MKKLRMMSHKGLFLTVEGGEGAGKTTLLNRVQQNLTDEGYSVVLTREPGGINIAEQIRSVILNPKNIKMDGRTEALLYAAARRQHLIEKIIPALQESKLVLCDRFIDSSLAYQGYARGLGIEEVFNINRFAIDHCMPQITLYLDLAPEIGLARIHSDQGREINRLDIETLQFHQKVREGYHQLAEMFPYRIIQINADQPAEAIFDQAMNEIKKIILNKTFAKE